MYQDALKQPLDSSKTRRYKRALTTIEQMLAASKAGRSVNMEDLPPPVAAKPPEAAVKKPSPAGGNLIDLDAPEFDEFNLSEEDIAAMAASMVDDRGSKQQQQPSKLSSPPPPVVSKPQKSSAPPLPTPSPRKPLQQPSKPPGLIDLDTPEFAEFDMTDEELEALAAGLVDDRGKEASKPAPPAPVPQQTTQSLPAKVAQATATPSSPPTREVVLAVLSERKDQYLKATRKAKERKDTAGEKRYGRTAVNFDHVIKALNEGKPVDLSQVPPPPPGFTSNYKVDISTYSAPPPATPPTTSVSAQSVTSSTVKEQQEQPEVDQEIPVPKTAMEALQQRLAKYKEGQKSAQEKGESSRVRRTGRIIKQYEDAIKMLKAGKPVEFSELPTPPGYPPIPAARPAPAPKAPAPAQARIAQSLPPSMPAVRKVQPSVSDQQLQVLQERIAHFKQAAKEAKGKGDKELAIKYLRYSKGVEQMLQAARGGLPIDMTQVF